jgi:hypothetical protein
MVSVIVPSRNERFLPQTVADVLANATGEVEVLVVLDGYWPDPPLDTTDKRLRIVHNGAPLGMRQAINAAASLARGSHLLKLDAHCAVERGFDEALRTDLLEDNWMLVPRRYPLDPDKWAREERRDGKYPVDAHYLSEPFERHGDSTPGLHGTPWRERRDARLAQPITEEMASQGSLWFMSRRHWERVGPLDDRLYGSFWHENQELALKTWLSGGAQMCTKRTSYMHLYKGKRHGRGYSTAGMGHETGTAFCSWFWMTDQPFKGRTRSMRWLIERFSPVPTWPDDLDGIFRRAHAELRDPYAAAGAGAGV